MDKSFENEDQDDENDRNENNCRRLMIDLIKETPVIYMDPLQDDDNRMTMFETISSKLNEQSPNFITSGDWVEMEWNSMCTILDSYISGRNSGPPEDWIFYQNMQFMIPYLKAGKDGISPTRREISISAVVDKQTSRNKRPKNPWRGISQFECSSNSESEDDTEILEEEQHNFTNSKHSESRKSNNSSNADHSIDANNFLDLSDETSFIKNHSTASKVAKTGTRGRKKVDIIKFNLKPSQEKMIHELEKYPFVYVTAARKANKGGRIHTFRKIAKKIYKAEHVAKHGEEIAEQMAADWNEIRKKYRQYYLQGRKTDVDDLLKFLHPYLKSTSRRNKAVNSRKTVSKSILDDSELFQDSCHSEEDEVVFNDASPTHRVDHENVENHERNSTATIAPTDNSIEENHGMDIMETENGFMNDEFERDLQFLSRNENPIGIGDKNNEEARTKARKSLSEDFIPPSSERTDKAKKTQITQPDPYHLAIRKAFSGLRDKKKLSSMIRLCTKLEAFGIACAAENNSSL